MADAAAAAPEDFSRALAPLEADRTREARSAESRQAALDATRDASAGKQEAEMAPLEQKAQAAIADAAALKPPAPAPAPLPEYKPTPIDPKDYQGFSMALIGMALIGGVASRGNWLGVNASLNGALTGFINGHHALADQEFKEYETKFKEAKAHDDRAQKEFEDILQNKQLSINSMLSQVKIAAAKYGREDIRQAAEQKSIDSIWKQVESTDHSLSTLQLQYERFNAQREAAKPPPVQGGDIGAIKTGMPLNQIFPGYGKAVSAQRAEAKTQAIQEIANEMHLPLEAAGAEWARRTVEYSAGKVSTGQLTKMLGATRQASAQLDFNIKKVSEEMAKLKSSNISPVINAIARGEEKWAGDPAYSGLFYFMNAAATESARLLSGGQASAAQLHQGAAEEAKQWANVNMTPASWAEVAESMQQEGRERLKTYEDAIAAGQSNFSDAGGGPGANPGGPEARVVDWNSLP